MKPLEIHTEILPESFHWDPTNPVTGTNKFYVRVAEEMAKSRPVVVYYDGPHKIHKGVTYAPRSVRRPESANTDVIDCNIDRPRLNTGRRLQWTSFFNRPDICVGAGYDGLLLVSSYVWSTLAPFVKAPVAVVELGCDMPVNPRPKLAERPKRCCYTSAPDRGLTMLQSFWAEVERETGYELAYSAYGGSQAESDVAALLSSSRFWLHPATGVELYCLSGIEAQALGCIPFYVPHMALPETVRYGIKTDLNRFKTDLIRTLKEVDAETFAEWEDARTYALLERPIPTWADVAEHISELL